MDYEDFNELDDEVRKGDEKEITREGDEGSESNREEEQKADDRNAQQKSRNRIPALRKSASQLRYPYQIADSSHGRMLSYCVIRNAHELDLALSR